MDLLVVAKEPVPGRVKTRLCPPCTPTEAATLAEGWLAGTLDAAMATGVDRVVLALEGRPGPWCPPGVEIVEQVPGPFDRRLAAAWAAAGPGPVVQIGMDTPHVGVDGLRNAVDTLLGPGVDAVLGPALDGGWWAAGLRRTAPEAFLGVPMSRRDTGARQRERFEALGLRTRDLPVVRDLDTWEDVVAVGYAPLRP